MTQQILDGPTSDTFRQLLEYYYEAIAADKAYNQLFGVNPGDPAEIAALMPSIRASLEAKKVIPLINTVESAKAAIDSSNFKTAQTTWRKFGAITLIDPDILPSSDLDIPWWAGQSIKDLFLGTAEKKTNLEFDTGIPQPNPSVATTTQLENVWYTKGASGPIQIPYPSTGFVSEVIIRHMINTGVLRSKRSDGSSSAYFDLADKLLALQQRIVKANAFDPTRILGIDGSDPYGIYDTWLAAKESSLKDLAAARTLLAGIQNLPAPLGGTLWTDPLVYTTADPRSTQVGLGTFGDQSQDERLIEVLEAEIPEIGGVFDTLIKTIAADVMGQAPLDALLAEQIKAKKQLYIDFLNGTKIESGDADTRSRSIETALKSEKVKEAVLKADRDVKPFDLQCHLMQNITKLETLRRTDPRFQPRYRHINPVVTNGKPAEVLNTIQHGGELHDEGIKQFINICPDVYGLLEPYIQIWRQEFNDDGKIKMKGGKAIEKRLHIDSFLNPADLDSRLKKTGRTPGAGIKSFSWSLKGVQPAEVDNNITANLVMHFQTINDFFNGASKAGNDDPNFLDLIINSPAVRKVREGMSKAPANSEKLSKCNLIRDHLHEQYKGVNYRIRVNAGWSVPPSLMPSVEIPKPLRQAIEQTQVSLYLQQVRHNLDFKQNGSLELSIDYVASIAGLLTSKSADIFAPQSSNQIEEEMKGIDQALEDIKVSTTDKTLTDPQRVRKKELLEQKRQARQEDRLIKYRKLLCGLFQEQNSRIYNLTVNALDLLRPPISELDEYQRAARAKRFKKEPVAVYFADEINFSLLDSVNTTLTGNGLKKEEGEQPPSTEQAARIFSDAEQSRFQDIKKDPGSFRFIPFFYLGDLIDSVLQQIKNNNQGSPLNFKMFLSETEMIDPNIALQIGDLEDVIKCGEAKDLDWLVRLVESDPQSYSDIAGLSNIMNIGDIPISLDAFQVWFKDNVIKKDRGSYFFLHFIKDICADLVTKAMGSQCFGTNINFQQRFDAQPLLLDNNRFALSPGRTVRSTTLGNLHKAVVPALDSNQTIGGFILVSTDSKPSDLTGDYQKDLSRGIYHHFIGASCGILKNMTFNREDQEYLREAKIQKFGALGAEQLRELYSARLDLVGNNLYKNGMYIYINPTLLGATEEELSYLGLHGYYLVTGVESKITPSGFTTNLTALHEGMRFERAQLPDVSLLTGVIAEATSPTINPMPKKEPEAQTLASLSLTESDMGALAARRAGLLDYATDTFQPEFPGDTRAAQEARKNINVPERP